ncbi:hypothetical protein BGW42_004161 [Actinomortierella wolfii]|nr:hypothetical protein BGW42_004161 [Actinomortierella wolfii]
MSFSYAEKIQSIRGVFSWFIESDPDVPEAATMGAKAYRRDQHIHQERKDAYSHQVYDPYRGNLCVSGRFLGLPVIISPVGALGNELGTGTMNKSEFLRRNYVINEILVRTRESITIVTAHLNAPQAISRIKPEYVQRADQLSSRPEPCSDLTIHACFSPYIPNQYALIGDRGRVAIWTRDASADSTAAPRSSINFGNSNTTTTTATSFDPLLMEDNTPSTYNAYLQHENDLDDYIMAVDEATHGRQSRGSKRRNISDMSGEKRARTDADEAKSGLDSPPKDQTRSLNIVRSAQSQVQEASDPWHSCSWAAHPCQLILASRSYASLLDFRGKNIERKLYDVKEQERIVAIQDADPNSGQPFQRYLATNKQVICIDQRMPNQPLISWAHHQGRDEPRGIEVVEMRVGDMDMSTVITWSERNAYITATSVSLDTHVARGGIRGRVVLGRPQELASFHDHPYYSQTAAYRETQYQWYDALDDKGRKMMSLKPALYGLSWMPQNAIGGDESENEGDGNDGAQKRMQRVLNAQDSLKPDKRDSKVEASEKKKRQRAAHFSLFQYSATGALYAQSIDVLPKFSGNRFAYDVASGQSPGERLQEYLLRLQQAKTAPDSQQAERLQQVRIGNILKAIDSQVAPWRTKKPMNEGDGNEEAAEKEAVTAKEVRDHISLDLTSLVNFLKQYLEMDRESDPRTSQVITDARTLQDKIDEALHLVQDMSKPNLTVFELVREIRCLDLPLRQREALQQGINEYLARESGLSSSLSRKPFQKSIQAWNAKEMKLAINPSSPDVTTKDIEQHLVDQYPLPRTVSLTASDEADASLARSMANMHVHPSGEVGQRGSTSPSSTTEWPSPAVRAVRQRTVQRLAQDLKLSSALVIKGRERSNPPQPPEERTQQEAALYPTNDQGDQANTAAEVSALNATYSDRVPIDFEFQYLFQSGNGGSRPRNPGSTLPQPLSTLQVQLRVKPIWQEWVVGADPNTYRYVPPGQDATEEDLEEERERREAQEREEKLLRLRMRREKRQAKTREARNRDMFHQSNATAAVGLGTSISQPTMGEGIGGIGGNSNSSWPMAFDDDDYSFSRLPTVVSTSSAAALRAKKASSSTAATAITTPSTKGGGVRRESDAPASLKKTVSFTTPQEASRDHINESAATLPTLGTGSSLDAVLEATNMPTSQEAITRTDFFSASQPVPGTFGSRPAISAASKKKKKKPRTQGF